MKPTKQQLAAAAFARKTERLEAKRVADEKLAAHRAEVKAQSEWDAFVASRRYDGQAELVAAAEELGIELSV